MSVPEKYRGIEFSLRDSGNGRWAWKVQPKVKAGVVLRTIWGNGPGTQDDAMVAAKAAIDGLLDGARRP